MPKSSATSAKAAVATVTSDSLVPGTPGFLTALNSRQSSTLRLPSAGVRSVPPRPTPSYL